MEPERKENKEGREERRGGGREGEGGRLKKRERETSRAKLQDKYTRGPVVEGMSKGQTGEKEERIKNKPVENGRVEDRFRSRLSENSNVESQLTFRSRSLLISWL